MTISPMMDRNNTDLIKMQINFIDFVASPLFDLLPLAFPGVPTLEVLCFCILSLSPVHRSPFRRVSSPSCAGIVNAGLTSGQ